MTFSKVLSNTQSTWPSSKLNPVSAKSKVAYSNHSTAVFQEQGNFQDNYRERPLWGMFKMALLMLQLRN